MSGIKQDSKTSCEQEDETFIANLKYAAAKLNQNNMTGLIEPINHTSVPGYWLHNYDKGMYILLLYQNTSIKLVEILPYCL